MVNKVMLIYFKIYAFRKVSFEVLRKLQKHVSQPEVRWYQYQLKNENRVDKRIRKSIHVVFFALAFRHTVI